MSDLNVQRIASIFGVTEEEVTAGWPTRLKDAAQRREDFLREEVSDETWSRIKRGETTLDHVLLFGDGNA